MRLSANPNFYDYLHYMALNEDGTFKMCDGGGQSINFAANGKWRIEYTHGDINNDDSGESDGGELYLTEIYQANVYGGEETTKRWDDIIVKFKIETGIYKLIDGRVWGLSSALDEHYLIYTKRYVFEFDPIAASPVSEEKRNQNLYFLVDRPDERGELVYYNHNDAIRKSWREWIEEGNELEDPFVHCYTFPKRGCKSRYDDNITHFIRNLFGEEGDEKVEMLKEFKNKQTEKEKEASRLRKEGKYNEARLVNNSATNLVSLFSTKGECIGLSLVINYQFEIDKDEHVTIAHIPFYKVDKKYRDNIEKMLVEYILKGGTIYGSDIGFVVCSSKSDFIESVETTQFQLFRENNLNQNVKTKLIENGFDKDSDVYSLLDLDNLENQKESE